MKRWFSRGLQRWRRWWRRMSGHPLQLFNLSGGVCYESKVDTLEELLTAAARAGNTLHAPDFKGADLRRAVLRDNKFDGGRFESTELEDALIANTEMRDVVFRSTIDGPAATLFCSFRKCLFSQARLHAHQCWFNDCHWDRADLTREKFTLCSTHNSVLASCNFAQIDGRGANWYRCQFRDVTWQKGVHHGADFVECRFENCSFEAANFAAVTFHDCVFAGCWFSDNCTLPSGVTLRAFRQKVVPELLEAGRDWSAQREPVPTKNYQLCPPLVAAFRVKTLAQIPLHLRDNAALFQLCYTAGALSPARYRTPHVPPTVRVRPTPGFRQLTLSDPEPPETETDEHKQPVTGEEEDRTPDV